MLLSPPAIRLPSHEGETNRQRCLLACLHQTNRNGGDKPMDKRVWMSLLLCAACVAGPAQAQQSNMTFFVTSEGSGKGADLGGLAGADRHCQSLAQAAGAGAKTWHAYLSTQAANGQSAVNARDRIGAGPWQNAKGVVVAKSVDELHG